MKPFQHVNAIDTAAALSFLQVREAVPIAGGTDLLTELKARIRTAERLVNLKTISQLAAIRPEGDALRIGSLTTIADIESSPAVNERFGMLAHAAALVGTPQIRNAGTLGGNLSQSVRCWYYRHPEIRCWLKGGDTCFARRGLNRMHAIFGKAPCVAVNPSDLAPALTALDAAVRVESPDGVREMPVESLYRLPDQNHRKQTTLVSGELITDITLPAGRRGYRGIYLKVMERAAWSFAVVSVAVRLDWTGDRVQRGRIVFGGVAGTPWRAFQAEGLLGGRRINAASLKEVCTAAVSGAEPLPDNSFKVSMARNLLRRALMILKAENTFSRPARGEA